MVNEHKTNSLNNNVAPHRVKQDGFTGLHNNCGWWQIGSSYWRYNHSMIMLNQVCPKQINPSDGLWTEDSR